MPDNRKMPAAHECQTEDDHLYDDYQCEDDYFYDVRPPAALYSSTQTMWPCYIFCDWSNIYVGAQAMKDGTKDLDVRVDIESLMMLLGHMGSYYQVAKRVCAGSSNGGEGSDALWDRFRSLGFELLIEKRGAKHKEQRVDFWLQASISRTVYSSEPGCIVLLTGDGNEDGEMSFPMMVTEALCKGFNVVVYAWERTMNPVFQLIENAWPGRMMICLLDQYRDEITFRQLAKVTSDSGSRPQPRSLFDDFVATTERA